MTLLLNRLLSFKIIALTDLYFTAWHNIWGYIYLYGVYSTSAYNFFFQKIAPQTSNYLKIWGLKKPENDNPEKNTPQKIAP